MIPELLPQNELATAISGGICFLHTRQDDNGLWRDFQTYADRSDEWVTGFVVNSIAGLPDGRAISIKGCHALLERQRTSGGWGYSASIPADADSTAWALRSSVVINLVQPHRMRSAIDFLHKHQTRDGGMATFARASEIGEIIHENDEEKLSGWTDSHTCVTANVVLALLGQGLSEKAQAVANGLDYLYRHRDPDYLWRSYWWQGPTYASYLAGLALCAAGRLTQSELTHTCTALLELQNSDGGWGDGNDGYNESHAFATAMAISTLRLNNKCKEVIHGATKGARWLLERQRKDGSWPVKNILRIPDAHISNPGNTKQKTPFRPGTNIVVEDDRQIFTTAAVIKSLNLYNGLTWGLR